MRSLCSEDSGVDRLGSPEMDPRGFMLMVPYPSWLVTLGPRARGAVSRSDSPFSDCTSRLEQQKTSSQPIAVRGEWVVERPLFGWLYTNWFTRTNTRGVLRRDSV